MKSNPNKRNLLVAVCGLALFSLGCAASSTVRLGLPPLQAVPRVELPRYLGTWYEIASFPQSFQKGCTATTATYSVRDDGDIDVLNKCRLETIDGEEKIAHGRARITDAATNAKLEVSFFRPFWGQYWVIELGEDYEYAVVGHPGRDYLWILSRTPKMDAERYQGILSRLKDKGYEIERLQTTAQRI